MPQQKIGTTGDIPWDASGMSIGSGYAIDEYQCVRSPFVPFEVSDPSKTAPEIRFESQTISTEHDLVTAVDFALDGSIAVPAIASKAASVKCLQEVKIGTKHMATIIRCSIKSAPQKYVAHPQLTEEAKVCLGGKSYSWFGFSNPHPERFLSQYGQHFVAGQVCQSTLLAVYVHTASTSKELDDFKSKISTSQGLSGVTSISSVANYTQEAKVSNITTKIYVHITGMRTDNVADVFSLTDIMPVFQGFLKDYEPVPYLALLQHYSLVVAGIPRPPMAWTIAPDLVHAFKRGMVLNIRSRSCIMRGASTVIHTASKLCSSLNQIELRDEDWRERLVEWSGETESAENQLSVWLQRQALLEKAFEKNAQRWPSEVLLKSKRMVMPVNWHTGIDATEFGPLASEISYECHKEQSLYDGKIGVLQCHEGKAQHASSDRLVIASRITNDTDSKPNLATKLLMASPQVGLLVRPVRHVYKAAVSGLWNLEIWSVDRELYAKNA